MWLSVFRKFWPFNVRKFIIFIISCIFIRSLSALSATLLFIHFTFHRLDKRISRIPSLLLSLKDVNIVIVHGPLLFIDSEIVFACLPRPFPLAWVKMNFPLYYVLFPLHGHSCRFLPVCLLLRNTHSSFCLQAFIHRCFHAHFVCRPLRFCFITRILLHNFSSCNICSFFGLVFQSRPVSFWSTSLF